MSAFRVMTYNIRNGGVGRERKIRDVVSAIRPDVAVFNELTPATAIDEIASIVGPHVALGGGRHARQRTAIVSRWPVVESERLGPRQRWVRATVRPFDGPAVTVLGVHLAAHALFPFEVWRWLEVRWLLRAVQLGRITRHILAGDFNALMIGDQVRRNEAPPWVRAQWILQGGAGPRLAMRSIVNAGYVDCYRAGNPQGDGYTVKSWNPSARVDYVFASMDIKRNLKSSASMNTSTPGVDQLLLGQASDHLPVWADFDWPE